MGRWSPADYHRRGRRSSPPQLRALLAVEGRESTNLGELATELGTIASSASRLCDRLQAAGLIVRRPGKLDRRAINLELTDAARRLLDRLRQHRRAQLATIVRRMSTTGAAALLTGLAEFAAATVADDDARTAIEKPYVTNEDSLFG